MYMELLCPRHHSTCSISDCHASNSESQVEFVSEKESLRLQTLKHQAQRQTDMSSWTKDEEIKCKSV